jgi:hypothetical protein
VKYAVAGETILNEFTNIRLANPAKFTREKRVNTAITDMIGFLITPIKACFTDLTSGLASNMRKIAISCIVPINEKTKALMNGIELCFKRYKIISIGRKKNTVKAPDKKHLEIFFILKFEIKYPKFLDSTDGRIDKTAR